MGVMMTVAGSEGAGGPLASLGVLRWFVETRGGCMGPMVYVGGMIGVGGSMTRASR